MCDIVRNFVTEDCSEASFVFSDRQEAGEDEDLAAR